MKNLLFLFSIFLLNQACMAQSLSQHEWKHRVILLFAPSFQNENLQQQLKIFQKDEEGLTDRKLIVYQITPDEIKKEGEVLNENSEVKSWFKKFNINKNEFTFILIGLDGGEKMRNSEVVSIDKLFSKIDRMPMRQSEINRNKN
ncbi:MAG: DUF4174 domain-containing protein [Saprospiraceae bacterium]